MNDVIFLVEGSDDERFVRDVLEPRMDERSEVIKYSQKPNSAVDDILAAVHEVYRGHYFVTDLDRGQQGCHDCDDREEYERDRYDIKSAFDILVAVDAVEGWYLAGVSDEIAEEKLVRVPPTTTHVDKSEFDDVFRDSEYISKERLKIDITEEFDYDLACDRSDSFQYVCDLIGV